MESEGMVSMIDALFSFLKRIRLSLMK